MYHLLTAKSFSCISEVPSRTVGTYAVTREETFGSVPFVKTRILDIATHYANLERLDDAT